MNNYESIVLLQPDLKLNQKQNIINTIKKFIETELNGYIVNIEDLGIKKLAYDFKGNSKAYYINFIFAGSINLNCIERLERFYRIKNEIIKFITVRKEF